MVPYLVFFIDPWSLRIQDQSSAPPHHKFHGQIFGVGPLTITIPTDVGVGTLESNEKDR